MFRVGYEGMWVSGRISTDFGMRWLICDFVLERRQKSLDEVIVEIYVSWNSGNYNSNGGNSVGDQMGDAIRQ